MDKLSDNLKKIFLAGIGAVAVTAEKSKDLLDEMEGECAETGIGRGTFGSS